MGQISKRQAGNASWRRRRRCVEQCAVDKKRTSAVDFYYFDVDFTGQNFSDVCACVYVRPVNQASVRLLWPWPRACHDVAHVDVSCRELAAQAHPKAFQCVVLCSISPTKTPSREVTQ